MLLDCPFRGFVLHVVVSAMSITSIVPWWWFLFLVVVNRLSIVNMLLLPAAVKVKKIGLVRQSLAL
jgi:hypothetical protein